MSSPIQTPANEVQKQFDPCDLSDEDGYRRWREMKLAKTPVSADELMVPVKDLARPSEAEREAIFERCQHTNMAIYDCGTSIGDDAAIRLKLRAFTENFGLKTNEDHRSAADDGIVALELANTGTRKGYIPYTNRPLSWHTDGYYNQPENNIRAMILHCVRDAQSGGENALMDPDIAYIRLRDTSRDLIAALMHPACMTIPANIEKNGDVREASVGPVFSVDPLSYALHMRYSARSRNIIWREDDNTRKAAEFLIDLFAGGADVITHRLKPGQGLICNNVLHNRTGFTEREDGQPGRLYYRCRFHNRVAGT